MKESIEGIKQITLREAEEYFSKPYDLVEDLYSRTPMHNYKGDIIGYIIIHGNEREY